MGLVESFWNWSGYSNAWNKRTFEELFLRIGRKEVTAGFLCVRHTIAQQTSKLFNAHAPGLCRRIRHEMVQLALIRAPVLRPNRSFHFAFWIKYHRLPCRIESSRTRDFIDRQHTSCEYWIHHHCG